MATINAYFPSIDDTYALSLEPSFEGPTTINPDLGQGVVRVNMLKSVADALFQVSADSADAINEGAADVLYRHATSGFTLEQTNIIYSTADALLTPPLGTVGTTGLANGTMAGWRTNAGLTVVAADIASPMTLAVACRYDVADDYIGHWDTHDIFGNEVALNTSFVAAIDAVQTQVKAKFEGLDLSVEGGTVAGLTAALAVTANPGKHLVEQILAATDPTDTRMNLLVSNIAAARLALANGTGDGYAAVPILKDDKFHYNIEFTRTANTVTNTGTPPSHNYQVEVTIIEG